jgi:hypothetical protein
MGAYRDWWRGIVYASAPSEKISNGIGCNFEFAFNSPVDDPLFRLEITSCQRLSIDARRANAADCG